ncbi:MAG: hypothetical protein ACRDQZ_05035, partial [Mycobacteriales bacterium]
NRIRGTFRTALSDSGFAGDEIPVSGIHLGNCVNFVFSRPAPTGDTLASFTGLFRKGKRETAWHVVADSAIKSPRPERASELMQLPWAHAVLTNVDTFERIQ